MDETQKELLRLMLVTGDLRGDWAHQATLDGLAANDLCLREIPAARPDGPSSMPTYRLTDKGKLVASLLL
jgi:hypothetical protein